jgi:hypothetical protein
MRTVHAKWFGLLAVVLVAAGSTGCESMSNTGKGALGGGAVGAGVGALAGGRTGALVGGAIGAGTGGLIGNAVDNQEKREIRQTNAAIAQANAAAAQSQQVKMGMMDVVHMVQQGHSPDVIITQIRNTGSTFSLSATDLDYLKSCNVPDPVIVAMQNARPVAVVAGPQRVYVSEPPPVAVVGAPAPVVVVGPRPYPYYYYRRPYW